MGARILLWVRRRVGFALAFTRLFAAIGAAVPLGALCACGANGAHEADVSDAAAPPSLRFAANGCIDGDEAMQRHNAPCVCCHAEFGVAGSVDQSRGAVIRVVVRDAFGNTDEMQPNVFGNFFRHQKLTPPLTPIVFGDDGRALTMKSPAPHGNCNACHGSGGAASALHAPL